MTLQKLFLASLLLAGCAGDGEAMQVNASGLGQVLISPYYTVNAGNQTQISIANRSGRGKALKVRFLEGMNGREVFDFNLYLAPHDLWTGALFSQLDSGPAILITHDDSCTVPALKNSTSLPQLPNGRRIAPFGNAQYSGAHDDAGPDDVGRTREGYFEIIEMGEVINAAQRSLNDISPGSEGVPANCARIESAWAPAGYWTLNPEADITVPGGDIAASISLVDALDGTMYSFQAEAIDRFSSIVQHSAPGSALPNLGSGVTSASESYVEAIIDVEGARIISRHPRARAIDAVSALFMAERVDNEFNIGASTGALSAWVVTLPTKKFYTDDAWVQATAVAPFTKTFAHSMNPHFSSGNTIFPPQPVPPQTLPEARGEAVGLTVRNREQGPIGQRCDLNPFCVPYGLPTEIPSLHWTSNVFMFGFNAATSVDRLFGSQLAQLVDASGIGVSEGWLRLDLYDANGEDSLPEHILRADVAGNRFVGLPAIGFWAVSYTNGQLSPGVLSNYASLRRHRTATSRLTILP